MIDLIPFLVMGVFALIAASSGRNTAVGLAKTARGDQLRRIAVRRDMTVVPEETDAELSARMLRDIEEHGA